MRESKREREKESTPRGQLQAVCKTIDFCEPPYLSVSLCLSLSLFRSLFLTHTRLPVARFNPKSRDLLLRQDISLTTDVTPRKSVLGASRGEERRGGVAGVDHPCSSVHAGTGLR
jgi:hypothetical protein